MRTLALLTALLLLAFQVQTEPLLGTAEEYPDEEQLEENDQVESLQEETEGSPDEEQTISISFGGIENPDLQKAGVASNETCTCQRRRCVSPERRRGFCRRKPKFFRLCCQ